MSCKSCEERRQKLKALINDSAKSISNAIARLGGRASEAEQPSVGAKQSTDSAPDTAEQPDQRIIVNTRGSGRSKRS
jgi:hypothetical protein